MELAYFSMIIYTVTEKEGDIVTVLIGSLNYRFGCNNSEQEMKDYNNITINTFKNLPRVIWRIIIYIWATFRQLDGEKIITLIIHWFETLRGGLVCGYWWKITRVPFVIKTCTLATRRRRNGILCLHLYNTRIPAV